MSADLTPDEEPLTPAEQAAAAAALARIIDAESALKAHKDGAQ